jgi:hypothetical protein
MVPVREDEELQVQVLEPKELEKEGDETKSEIKASHGRGTAAMEKKGRSNGLSDTLGARRGHRVVLEYATKAPKGSEVDTA